MLAPILISRWIRLPNLIKYFSAATRVSPSTIFHVLYIYIYIYIHIYMYEWTIYYSWQSFIVENLALRAILEIVFWPCYKHQMFCTTAYSRASIHSTDGRLTTRSREVSKPRDSGLHFSHRCEICQNGSSAFEMPVNIFTAIWSL